jgi:DNA-binding NarL/FixJ family response regulator
VSATQVGLGSVDRLRLSTKSPPFQLSIVSASDEPSGAALGQAPRPRLLIVEDDFLVTWQMEEALAEAGFMITGVASSADEAIQAAGAVRPDLVLMDIRLRGDRDGVEAALELFARYGLRCLFTTAHTTGETRGRADPANPVGWLPKPYTMPALVRAVRRGLEAVYG